MGSAATPATGMEVGLGGGMSNKSTSVPVLSAPVAQQMRNGPPGNNHSRPLPVIHSDECGMSSKRWVTYSEVFYSSCITMPVYYHYHFHL